MKPTPSVHPVAGYLVVDHDDDTGDLYVVEPGCIEFRPVAVRHDQYVWPDPDGHEPGIQHEPDDASPYDADVCWYCYEHPDAEWPGDGPYRLERALRWLWKHGPRPRRLMLVEDGDVLRWVSP